MKDKVTLYLQQEIAGSGVCFSISAGRMMLHSDGYASRRGAERAGLEFLRRIQEWPFKNQEQWFRDFDKRMKARTLIELI